MILNFKSPEDPKHIFIGGDFDHKYSSGQITIYLKADTKNNIFRTRYLCPENLIPYFESICRFIQDKNLDNLIESFAREFQAHVDFSNISDLVAFEVELSILHFREALLVYRGDMRDIKIIDSENLICRCMGIDLAGLREIFIQTKGEKAVIAKQSSMSLICGECSALFKDSLKTLALEERLFEGKEFTEWQNEIEKHLSEFHFYSPKEFATVEKIQVQSLNLPELELLLVGKGEMPTERQARTSLANYLGQELKLPLDIKISFRN